MCWLVASILNRGPIRNPVRDQFAPLPFQSERLFTLRIQIPLHFSPSSSKGEERDDDSLLVPVIIFLIFLSLNHETEGKEGCRIITTGAI